MTIKLNYTMVYTEQVRDLILDKLTILFNKATLNAKVKLLLRIPDMFDLQRTQRYREIFDEVCVSRFTIEDPSFWNMRNLHNFQDYCLNMDQTERDTNIFIEQSTLVYDINSDVKGDIMVSGTYRHDTLATQYASIVELLNNNGYKIELRDDFTCWDLSCCYLNNNIKKILYFTIGDIIKKISSTGRYLNQVETHILVSALIHDMIDEFRDFSFIDMNLKKSKIDSKLVEHMYTII